MRNTTLILSRSQVSQEKSHDVKTRGGVEDTRLEAKAKDTKKSEAKAKDSLSEDRHSQG